MHTPVPATGAACAAEQREWLAVRDHLRLHRAELSAVAAARYPDAVRVAGTSLLSAPDWFPDRPIPLQGIAVRWHDELAAPAVTGTEEFTEPLRPGGPDGARYPSYAAAMGDLAAPRIFENRSTYRLASADLTSGRPTMGFGPGHYSDGIDVGEACAHELAAFQLGLIPGTPLRDAVGDPCDPRHRPANLAVACLTTRVDDDGSGASFPLHWRDPAKVGHAGGLAMVVPVGVFQASDDGPEHHPNDFSLWRSLLREFAEELLGHPEDHGPGPIDYDAWPFAARMTQALRDGEIRADVYGIGIDALTFAADLLVQVSIPAALYDDLFGDIVDTNEEGALIRPEASTTARWPLSDQTVRQFGEDRMQAAALALLRLALARNRS